MEQESASGTQAAERLLAVLEIVGSSDDGAEVASIASALGLSLSTTYRLVGVLQKHCFCQTMMKICSASQDVHRIAVFIEDIKVCPFIE